MAEVWKALEEVRDPELGYNVVELGLIYDVRFDEDSKTVYVKMTLTAPGCPYGPELVQQVRSRVESIEGVEKADVELVFDPPWDPYTMVSQDILLELGLL